MLLPAVNVPPSWWLFFPQPSIPTCFSLKSDDRLKCKWVSYCATHHLVPHECDRLNYTAWVFPLWQNISLRIESRLKGTREEWQFWNPAVVFVVKASRLASEATLSTCLSYRLLDRHLNALFPRQTVSSESVTQSQGFPCLTSTRVKSNFHNFCSLTLCLNKIKCNLDTSCTSLQLKAGTTVQKLTQGVNLLRRLEQHGSDVHCPSREKKGINPTLLSWPAHRWVGCNTVHCPAVWLCGFPHWLCVILLHVPLVLRWSSMTA